MSRACSQLCIGLSRTGTDEKKGRAEGRTEGLAEGMEKGEAKGQVEERLKNACNLKKNGVPIDVIAISLGIGIVSMLRVMGDKETSDSDEYMNVR